MSATLEAPAGNGQQIAQRRESQDAGVNSNLMDSARYEQMKTVAGAIANSSMTPKHLIDRDPKKTLANCIRVVNQAFRWQLDPFAVVDETYVVHGRLGYQGKLIAAVVNARSGLVGRLRYEYIPGDGDKLGVKVIGRFEGEDFDRDITLYVGQAKTQNDMWTKDPRQKLAYSAVTKWARLHCPEVILGVATEDDLERIRDANGPGTVPLSAVTERLVAPNSDSAALLAASQLEPGETMLADGEIVSDAKEEASESKQEEASELTADLTEVLSDLKRELTEAKDLAAVQKIEDFYLPKVPTDKSIELHGPCDEKREAIRAQRGSKSNQKSLAGAT